MVMGLLLNISSLSRGDYFPLVLNWGDMSYCCNSL